MSDLYVARLVQYGLESGLIPEEERIYSTNQILEVMKKDDYEAPTAEEVGTEIDLADTLNHLLDEALESGVLEDGGVVSRDLFDTKLTMSKADMLDYHQSMMDHAMVLTGVDLVDGKPAKWKVENSWGPKVGEKGYFVMSDEWMDQYVYQIVVNKKYLSDELKADQAQEPIVLKPWDPMGTLA